MSALVVATTYPVHPALGGGQQRVVGLYGAAAAQGVPVDVVALVSHGERATTHEIAPGLREIRVPKTAEHDEAEHELSAKVGLPITDVALALHHELTPAYAQALRDAAADGAGARAMVACHSYPVPAIEAAATGLPVLYEAQDVESDLKAAMLREAAADNDAVDGETVERLVAAVHASEAHACAVAELTYTCSDVDAARLTELFDLDPERVTVAANGCHCADIPYTQLDERAGNKAAIGVDDFTVLFVGSWHGPNLEAARAVCATARERPDMRFLVVGSAGLALTPDEVPPNVDAPGPVPDGFLDATLRFADVAVNPMTSGSGTNLKMLQYGAAGVPLVSSEFGARGLGFVAGEHYAPGEPEALAAALDGVRGEDPQATAARVTRAHDRVAETFDWPVIAAGWLRHPVMERILHT